MIQFTFLSENKVGNPTCNAEFGLSLYIEAKGKHILFDAGGSDLFLQNAEKLGVDLTSVDFAVISHGHYDHTEGFPAFAQVNNQAPIYLHKNGLAADYGETDGEIDDYNCGILWSPETVDALRPQLRWTDGPVWIDEDMVISGTIPSLPDYAPSENFYHMDESGNLIPDTMDHEQFLAIRGENGIYLFSGCSHKGILAAVEYAKTLFPGERFAAIVAGMHLLWAPPEMRQAVTERLLEENPDVLIPVHCTGLEAIFLMKMKFADRCYLAGAGDRYRFEE